MKKTLRGMMLLLVMIVCLAGGVAVEAKTKKVPSFMYMTEGYDTMQVENTEEKMVYTGKYKEIYIKPYQSKNLLYVPVKYIASGMNGTSSYNKKAKKTTIKIDGTTFIFTTNKAVVTINHKNKKMKGKAVLKEGYLYVPASVFINQLKSTNVTVYQERCIIFRSKLSKDSYTSHKEPIGNCVPDNLDWKTAVKRMQNGKEAAKKADEILSKIIQPGMNDLEKVMAINDYLVSHTTYDGDVFDVYGPLIYEKGVCQGYAFCADLLLNKAGVPCIRVEGYAGVEGKKYNSDILDAIRYGGNLHEWNMVKVDGKWYHLDVTFNDATVNNKESDYESYQYFLLSDEQISVDHVWRRAFYKKASTPFYSENQLNPLIQKGYPAISGSIALPEGVTAPKGGVKVTVESYNGNEFTYQREYLIPEGKNCISFQAMMGKSFSASKFMECLSVTTKTRGYERKATVVNSQANNYQVMFKQKQVNLIQGKIVLPKSAVFDSDYEYSVSINIYQKVEGQNGMSGCGSDTYEGKAKANQKELYFDFDCEVPAAEYSYSLHYSINYEGNKKCSFVSYGYVTESGTVTDDVSYVRGSVIPLTSLLIQPPEATNTGNTSENQGNGTQHNQLQGVVPTKSVRNQIIKELKKYAAGNRGKLSKLKSLNAAKKFEGKTPDETSLAEDGTSAIYYYHNYKNGIKISNVYVKTPENKFIDCTYTVSNLRLTNTNYMKILNELNTYLKVAAGAKKKAVFEVTNLSNYKEVTYNSKERDSIFKKVKKGTHQLSVSYFYKDEEYKVVLYSNGSGELRIMIARYVTR